MRRYVTDGVFLLVVAVLAVTFTLRLFWPEPSLIVTPDFGRSDAWHFSFATKYLLGESLKQGQLPLWTSLLGTGFPLLSEGQIGTFYLPNLIVYKLFEAPLAYNISIVIILILLGWGMYLWLRSLSLSPVSSLFAATSLVFSGIVIPQLTHFTLLAGFSVLPWVMLGTRRVVVSPTLKNIAILSFLVSQQIFSGFPQATFVTGIFALAYALFLSRSRHHGRVFAFLAFLSSLLLATGLSAVQILPSWEFLSQSSEPRGFSPEAASYFSYPIKHLVTLLWPYILGNPRLETYPAFTAFDGSIFWENSGFIGIVPLVFAALAFLKKRAFTPGERGTINFSLFSLALSFVLMLGSHSPLYLLYSIWPFTLFRVPSRFIWLFVVSLLILSSYGVAALERSVKRRFMVTALVILATTVNLAFLWKAWWNYHAIVPAKEWMDPPEVTRTIAKGERVVTIGAELSHNRSFLKEGWQRTEPYFFLRNSLAPDANVLWGKSNARVYAGRTLARTSIIDALLSETITANPQEATMSAVGKKVLDLLSVQKVIATLALTQTGLTHERTLTDDEIAISIYTNPDAVPRVYLSSSAIIVPSVREAIARLREPSFLPGKTVLLHRPIPATGKESAGAVRIEEETDTLLRIRIEGGSGPAILVVADTYYPGWEASLDSQPAEVFPVNISQRGVLVPGGSHEVVFAFRPQSVQRGVRISALSLVITILLVVYPLFVVAARRFRRALLLFPDSPHNRGRRRPRRG